MKGTMLTRLASVVLICVGLLVMVGWATRIPGIVALFSSQINMVFNSALGFFLVGSALLITEFSAKLQRKLHFLVGTAIALLAITTIAENVFDYSFGIDQLFASSWLSDQNPHPGRMAENSALAFLFAGLAFILLNVSEKKWVALTTRVCIFSTLILGFSALTGYLFGVKSLYSWHTYAQMSLLSAICNSFLGMGLWSLWYNKIDHAVLSPENEGKSAISSGLTILFCLILLGSLTAFNVTFNPDQHSVELKSAALIAIIVGMSVLFLQLVPLIRQILLSEKKLININKLLSDSENRFRSAFDYAAIGMALISPQGKLLKVNQSLCQILGYTEEELLNVDYQEIMHLEDIEDNKLFFGELLKGTKKTYQKIQRYLHKNREIVWVSVCVSLVKNAASEAMYFIVQLQNITAEKRAEEQLRHLAYHDALTGLYNRNRLEQRMQEILLIAQRNQHGFAMIFLDLDRFKNINDTIGHDAGDMLLQVVGNRLKNDVRGTDIIARVGGDEFIIILNNLNQVERISNVVSKISEHLAQPIVIKGHEIYVTTSMGISVYPYDGEDVQTLMKNADLALYRAKELGRNNYQFCTMEMTAKARQKMARQNAIMQAMAKNEFTLYFQPTLDLNNQKISGVEALLRWHNAEYSNINASEIIQLAEDTGLIIALNEWVFKTACLQVKKWHEAGFHPLTLSVNLSGRQFKQLDFVSHLMQMLEETKFPPECLELEITEGLIMQDPEYILHTLHQLKEKQISIAIDDFGTGYSSLDYLRRFSIDKIKIDRKFIQTLTIDSASTSVVSAIIAMSNKLGIKTVAEGVENREQYDFLLQEKCSEVQGFYLIPPSDVATITKFLKNPMMQSYLLRAAENNDEE